MVNGMRYADADEPPRDAWGRELARVAASDPDDVLVVAIASEADEIGDRPAPTAFAAEDPAQRPYAELRTPAKRDGLAKVLVDHGGPTPARSTTPRARCPLRWRLQRTQVAPRATQGRARCVRRRRDEPVTPRASRPP